MRAQRPSSAQASVARGTRVAFTPFLGVLDQAQTIYLQESSLTDSIATVVGDSAAWARLWHRIVGEESSDSAALRTPPVDFSREMVLVYGRGRENTMGGFRLTVESAVMRGDTMVVRIRKTNRFDWRCFVANDGSDSPVALATTPRKSGPVRFDVHNVRAPCRSPASSTRGKAKTRPGA